jgi:hypothetical protein
LTFSLFFLDNNLAVSTPSSQKKVKISPLELTSLANHSDNPEGVDKY